MYPVLASAGSLRLCSLCISEEEVAEVFPVSLRHLSQPHNAGVTRFRDGSEYTLPVYPNTPHRIWGLTAVIVHQALTIIAPTLYTHRVKHTRNLHRKRKQKLGGNHAQS